MATRINRLTALAVTKLKKPGLYSDGLGLYVQVSGDGKEKIGRSWLFKFTLNGRAREMGLGSAGTFSLSEAREAARRARQLLHQRLDPIEVRNAERAAKAVETIKAISFRECCRAYLEKRRVGWRSAEYAVQWEKQLTAHIYPLLGDLPVGRIDVGVVVKALSPIWQSTPDTASRLRQRIESVLDHAIALGYREPPNPARWKGHLDHILPEPSKLAKVQHFAALPYREVGEFIARLRAITSTAARALEFLVLTATRTGDVRCALWAEIDFHQKLWTIPAERFKSDRDHRIPLSAPALSVLKVMQERRMGGFIFPGTRRGKPMAHDTMRFLLHETMGYKFNVHGFRSTFRDWAGESTNFPREVCEMALGHSVRDAVEAAYARGDLFEKRRRLMESWSGYCGTVRAASGEVTPLRR